MTLLLVVVMLHYSCSMDSIFGRLFWAYKHIRASLVPRYPLFLLLCWGFGTSVSFIYLGRISLGDTTSWGLFFGQGPGAKVNLTQWKMFRLYTVLLPVTCVFSELNQYHSSIRRVSDSTPQDSNWLITKQHCIYHISVDHVTGSKHKPPKNRVSINPLP